MLRHHTDLILGHQLLDSHTSEGAIDVQTLSEHRWCDELVLWRFFVQLLVCVLVKQHKVVGLLLNLSLRPLLLLRPLHILRRGLAGRSRGVLSSFALLWSHVDGLMVDKEGCDGERWMMFRRTPLGCKVGYQN